MSEFALPIVPVRPRIPGLVKERSGLRELGYRIRAPNDIPALGYFDRTAGKFVIMSSNINQQGTLKNSRYRRELVRSLYDANGTARRVSNYS